MKNKFSILLVLAILMAIGLGCSMITDRVEKSVSGDKSTSNDNRSVTDKAVDGATDTETTGIPECDDAFRLLADQASNKDDNIATRATKNFIFGQIKKQLKQSIEENKGDTKQMAEKCTDFKKQLELEINKDKNKDSEANKQ